MKKLKICFVTEDFYPNFIGGQGVYGYNLVSQLEKLGVDVTILAERREGRKEFWGNKKVRVILVPFVSGNQLLLAFFEYVYFIFRFRNKYFDIVHANQLSGLLFVLFKPRNVKKVIVSVHNANSEMARATSSPVKKMLYQPLILLERLLYERADGILTNSPKEIEEVKKLISLSKKPVQAIPLGVDIPKYSQRERQLARKIIRKQLQLLTNAKIVLYVGRLVKRKRVDVLIKSLDLLKDRNVVDVIIGEGVDRQRLEKIASDNIFFLGFVDDLRHYFLAADLFVTVSVAEGGFLLAGLEAASFGLPMILSPSAAGFPIIKEGINGYIVEPDSRKLAEKIQTALKKSKEMGKESQKIAKQFTWERCARQTQKFYQQLFETH